MATIGKTTVGLTPYQRTSGAAVYGPYMASEDGTIDTLSVYSETTGVNVRIGVYQHDEEFLESSVVSPRPTTLIADTGFVSITEAGWQTAERVSGTGAIERGKRYWIGAFASGPITYREDYTNERIRWNTDNLSNPFVVGGGRTDFRAMSAYVSYTPTPPSSDDTSLQARINRAVPGSTVRIRRGFYNERIIVNKPLKLVGVRDRKGRLPIIQGGTLIDNWAPSEAAEHAGKNVWYTDIRIGPNNSDVAVFVRSLMLGEKSVVVIQARPFLHEGASEAEATSFREHVLTCGFDDTGFSIVANELIDFWQWYDAIACHDITGRLWLRMKNNVNPKDSACYFTATQNQRTTSPVTNTDILYSNEIASTIKCENQTGVTIRNLEIRGGRRGIDIQNSSNVTIENCKIIGASSRAVDITNCNSVRIRSNEISLNPTQQNLGAGLGGNTARANAMKFGRSVGKNYSGGQPQAVGLVGVTSSVVVSRNWMHGLGSGIAWGDGFDVHLVHAIIENNLFEKMSSTGLICFGQATGTARNNQFFEVHFAARLQDMSINPSLAELNNLVRIENNSIITVENAGYVMQAHYATFYRRITYSGGSGSLPAVGDNVSYSVGGGTGRIVRFESGNNVSGVVIVEYVSVAWPTTGTVTSGSWSANMTAISITSDWTTPVIFNNNRIHNVSTLIANVLSFADVEMDGNVIDTLISFPSSLISSGLKAFTNNWVGGNAGAAPNQAWWGTGNSYSVNQRLPQAILPALPVLPVGFEEVGPYQQRVGLPVIRGDKTYGERFSG